MEGMDNSFVRAVQYTANIVTTVEAEAKVVAKKLSIHFTDALHEPRRVQQARPTNDIRCSTGVESPQHMSSRSTFGDSPAKVTNANASKVDDKVDLMT
jgi:hypothetical protein